MFYGGTMPGLLKLAVLTRPSRHSGNLVHPDNQAVPSFPSARATGPSSNPCGDVCSPSCARCLRPSSNESTRFSYDILSLASRLISAAEHDLSNQGGLALHFPKPGLRM